jgi:glycosyltransferase involved in cell wall biosynthesis
MPKSVAVVITCYNLQAYIEQAIRSVVDQEFDGEMDILVVDDCSTDGSAQTIQRLTGLSRAVRYLKTERNLGVLMATVIGIENTRGELVFFLDGDDVWEPQKVTLCAAAFDRDVRVNLVTHDLTYIDAQSHVLPLRSRPDVILTGAEAYQQGVLTQQGILGHTDFVWLGSAYAIDRKKSDADGFCRFAKNLPEPSQTYQDWPLACWAASRRGAACAYVAEKLFRYRLHGKNHSGDASDVAKAVRNVRRTYNTMQAIWSIVLSAPVESPLFRLATQRKLAFYDYMTHLYAGCRGRAAWGLLHSVPYIWGLGLKGFFREWARFAVVQIFGLPRFIQWRARQN